LNKYETTRVAAPRGYRFSVRKTCGGATVAYAHNIFENGLDSCRTGQIPGKNLRFLLSRHCTRLLLRRIWHRNMRNRGIIVVIAPARRCAPGRKLALGLGRGTRRRSSADEVPMLSGKEGFTMGGGLRLRIRSQLGWLSIPIHNCRYERFNFRRRNFQRR
jgi:hypothetical protein